VNSVSRALAAVDDLTQEMLDPSVGTETFGAGSARQGVKYTQVLRALADLSNAGVLQEGERAALEASLPDPTGYLIGMRPGGARRAATAYDAVAGMLLRKASDMWRQSPEGVLGRAAPAEWGRVQERVQRGATAPPAPPPGFRPVDRRSPARGGAMQPVAQ
jgi:hypothetical protein